MVNFFLFEKGVPLELQVPVIRFQGVSLNGMSTESREPGKLSWKKGRFLEDSMHVFRFPRRKLYRKMINRFLVMVKGEVVAIYKLQTKERIIPGMVTWYTLPIESL